MKRSLGVLLIVFGLISGLAPNAWAEKKSGRCADGFVMQDKKTFVKARNDAGAPADGEGPAIFDSIDANGNGHICVRPLPDTPGNPAWFVVASDDTIPPRK